jgi:hypothetical protein
MITIIACSFGNKSSDENPNEFKTVNDLNSSKDSNTSGFFGFNVSFGGDKNSDFKPVEDDKNSKPWVQDYESKGNGFFAATDPMSFGGKHEDSLSELDKAFIFAPEDKKLKKTKSKSKSKPKFEETIPAYARPSSMSPKHTSEEYHKYNELMQKNLKKGNKRLPLPEIEEDQNSFSSDSREFMDKTFRIPVTDNDNSLNISDLYDFDLKKPKSNFIKDSKANITYGNNGLSANNPFEPFESKSFECSGFSSIESNVLPDTKKHKNDFFYNILSKFQLILGKYNNQCAGVLGDCLSLVQDNIEISSVNKGSLKEQIDIYLNTVKSIVSKVLFAYIKDSKVYGNVNDCWIVLVREFHRTIVSQLELCKPKDLNNWNLGDLHNYVIVDFGEVQNIKIIKKSDYSKESVIFECGEFLKNSKNINYKVNNKSNASKLDNKKNEHRVEESKNLIDGNSHIVSSITKVLWPSYKNFIIQLIGSGLQLTDDILKKHQIKLHSSVSELNDSLMARLFQLNDIIEIFDALINSKSDDIFKGIMKAENENKWIIKEKIDNAFSSIETVWWGFLNKLKIQGVIDFDEILWIKLRKLFADKFGSSKFEWNEIYKLDMSGEFASITLDSLLSVEFEELSYGKTIKYKDPQKVLELIVEFSKCKLGIEEFDNALMASELNKKLPCSNLSSGHESLNNSDFSMDRFDRNYPKNSNNLNSKFSNSGESRWNSGGDLLDKVEFRVTSDHTRHRLSDIINGVPQDDNRRVNGSIEAIDIGFRRNNPPINMYKPQGGKEYNTHDKSTFGPSVPVETEVPRYISNSGFDACREYFLRICEENDIKSINGSCDIFARSISNKAERIKWLGDELMHWHKKFDELHEKSIEVYFIYDGKLRKYVLNRNSVTMNDNELKKYVNKIGKYEDNLNNLISKNFVNLFDNYLKELMKFTIDKKVNQLYGPQSVGNAQKLKDMNNKFTNGMRELAKIVINDVKILHNKLMMELGLGPLNKGEFDTSVNLSNEAIFSSTLTSGGSLDSSEVLSFLKICKEHNIDAISAFNYDEENYKKWIKDQFTSLDNEISNEFNGKHILYVCGKGLGKYVLNLKNDKFIGQDKLKKYDDAIRKYEDGLNQSISQGSAHLLMEFIKENKYKLNNAMNIGSVQKSKIKDFAQKVYEDAGNFSCALKSKP